MTENTQVWGDNGRITVEMDENTAMALATCVVLGLHRIRERAKEAKPFPSASSENGHGMLTDHYEQLYGIAKGLGLMAGASEPPPYPGPLV